MKVFVATSEKQGGRDNDFHFCDEGELVMLPMECDDDKYDIDGGCGCRRAFAGCYSRKATTTAKVVERNLAPDEYHAAIAASLHNSGWCFSEADCLAMSTEMMLDAAFFETGSIIERRGDKLNRRF